MAIERSISFDTKTPVKPVPKLCCKLEEVVSDDEVSIKRNFILDVH